MAVRARSVELGAGALALGGSWVVARRALPVPGWESQLTVWVNDLPGGMAVPLWPVMQLGNLWMVAALPAGLWLATRQLRPALAGSVATAAAWGLAKVVKARVGRGRPADMLPRIQVREAGVHGPGYVSGHAAVAFAAATVVAVELPRGWRVVPFLLATVTGVARVYDGAHLPLDVVGGAGLGVACGALGLLLTGAPPGERRS